MKMARALVWDGDPRNSAWTCSECHWRYPVPTLLTDPEAKKAYDRLASGKFNEHICELVTPRATSPLTGNTSTEPTFMDRVRRLSKVGYKPKDAVALALDEMGLEYRNDAKVMSQARAEGDEFLRKVREGVL